MCGGYGRRGCCSSTWPSWRSCSPTRAPASRSPRSRRSAGSGSRATGSSRSLRWPSRLLSPGSSRSGRSRGPRSPTTSRPTADRVNDGAWFGVLLTAGAAIAAGVAYWLAGRALSGRRAHRLDATARVACRDRRPRRGRGRARGQGRRDPGRVPRHRRQGGLADSDAPRRAELEQPLALVAGSLVAVEGRAARGEGRGDLRGRPARHPPRARSPRREPHNVALQFLAETGIVGFLLLLGAIGTGATAAVCAVRRAEGGERAAAAALALGLGAYVLHGLVDIHWEFVAVTAPAFFVLGALIGLCARRRARVSRPVWALAGVAGLGVLYSLVAPYSSARLVDSAYSQLASDRSEAALSDARAARTLDPLATDPLYALGDAEAARARRGGCPPLLPARRSTSSRRTRAPGTPSARTSSSRPGTRRRSTTSTARTASIRYGPAGRPGGLLDQARAKVLGGA